MTGPAPQKPREYVITLTESEVNVAFNALMELPARVVNPLLAKVQAQIAEQQDPPARAGRDADTGRSGPAERASPALEDAEDTRPARATERTPRRVQEEPDPLVTRGARRVSNGSGRAVVGASLARGADDDEDEATL